MEMFLEGARSTDESRRLAYSAPFNELPVLTPEESQAIRGGAEAQERYVRSVYSHRLAEPYWSERIERVGKVVEEMLASSIPGAKLVTITLKSDPGIFHLVSEVAGRRFTFQIREEVVDDLLDGGDKEALNRIERIVDMAVLPLRREARAS